MKPPRAIQPADASAEPTRVLCVDDSADMTAVMRMVLETEPTMRCAGCLASADRLMEHIRKMSPAPHVVLLDASMPGKDPLKVMTEMVSEFPGVRTIIYSGHSDGAFVKRVKEAGAWGCLSKSEEPDAILRAVREVAAGRTMWA